MSDEAGKWMAPKAGRAKAARAGNELEEGKMTATSMAEDISPERLKVMERAEDPKFVYLSLAHLMDEAALTRAYHRIRKDAAVGVDGITKEQYGQELESNIRGRAAPSASRRSRTRSCREPCANSSS